MAAGNSNRVVIAALLANAGIAVAKGIAAAITLSGAMLAETIHSVADSGNQALLLLGAKRAKRPPDGKHPFGYGSERFFWAFIVALVLFSLGSLFSLYEGVHKLAHPTPIRKPAVAYAVLLTGVVLEGLSFLVARGAVIRARRGRGFWEYFFESKAPSLPLVYLEDSGALIGLALALLGVACSHLLEWTFADALATLAVGVLLGAIAIVLLIRCHRLLIGEAASQADARAIYLAASGVAGVRKVVSLKTLHVGPESLMVAIEARLDGGAEVVRAVEAAIQEAVPQARFIAVEPA